MSELGFVLKTFGITLAIVILMQIRVGTRTVEQHSLAWVHHSSVGSTLGAVSQGAVKATTKTYDAVRSLFGPRGDEKSNPNEASSSRPGRETEVAATGSRYTWKIKRSDAYQRSLERQKDDQASETN